LPLLQSFNILLDLASQKILTCEITTENHELNDEVRNFLYERIISPLMKKESIPQNPLLGLEQLRIWAKLDDAEERNSIP
jgi:hypothetical protein